VILKRYQIVPKKERYQIYNKSFFLTKKHLKKKKKFNSMSTLDTSSNTQSQMQHQNVGYQVEFAPTNLPYQAPFSKFMRNINPLLIWLTFFGTAILVPILAYPIFILWSININTDCVYFYNGWNQNQLLSPIKSNKNA
jgi:hypothetical protein